MKKLNMELIPNIFHLTWKSKDLPEVGRACLEKVRLNHPEWEIRLYDDNDCRKIISEKCSELLQVYDSYPTNIQRADFFRVVIVYLFGGFYMDIDFLLEKSINELRESDIVLAEEKTLTEKECISLKQAYPLRIANYIFGGKANQPFFRDLISIMIDFSQVKIKSQEDILNSTGPAVFSKFYSDNLSTYRNITLVTNDKNESHFGDFGVHLHQGSWRGMLGFSIFKSTLTPRKVEANTLREIQLKFKSRKA